MRERGIRPYVMPYDRDRQDLRRFERWVNLGLYRRVPWEAYDPGFKTERRRARAEMAARQPDLFA